MKFAVHVGVGCNVDNFENRLTAFGISSMFSLTYGIPVKLDLKVRLHVQESVCKMQDVTLQNRLQDNCCHYL